MSKLVRKRRSKKTGMSPGSIVHVGDKKVDEAGLTLFHYSIEGLEERRLSNIEECLPYLERSRSATVSPAPVTWLNIDGLHDVQLIERIGEIFKLHALVLEDIANTAQRPTRMEYEEYTHVCMKSLTANAGADCLETEQLSFVLGSGFVLSFQERPGDCFEPLRERLRQGKGRARKLGSDYLFYALIDLMVDEYFVLLEQFGERVETLETKLLDDVEANLRGSIHTLRREMLFIRRAVWPLREVISGLLREESGHITTNTKVFIRDVYDHTVEVIDIIETLREMTAGMGELYMSNVSNRVNAVMKTLTVISTIFLPLTFIAGVYGMNFQYMPELAWSFGYPLIMGFMLLLALIMLYLFRRRGWI